MKRTIAVSPAQFTIVVTMFTIGSSVLLIPTLMAHAAEQNAWIAGLFGLVPGMAIVLLIGTLAKRFSKESLFEVSEIVFGKWAGIVINLLFFIFFFLLSSILLREMADFLTIKVMPETPMYAIEILFMTAIVYGSRLGFETVSRSAEIFFPYVLLLFAIITLFLFPNIDTDKIKPIMEGGMRPILHGGYFMVAVLFAELFVFLVYSPYINDPKKSLRCLFTGSLFGSVMVLIVTLMTILVLGENLTQFHMYPSYALAKRIDIAHFIERIEVLIAGIWFLTIFIKLTVFFNASCLCVKHLFRLKTQHFLTFPLGILLINLALIVSPDIIYFRQMTEYIWAPYGITMGVILPLLIWIVALIRKKKSST